MPIEKVEEIGPNFEVYLLRKMEVLEEAHIFVVQGTLPSSVSERPRRIAELQLSGHRKSQWTEVSTCSGEVTARGVEGRATRVRPNGLPGNHIGPY